MNDDISIKALFQAGLTKEQFIEKYTELRENERLEEPSIFDDESDYVNVLGQIFDTINANGNDTIEEEEIINIQGLGDNDNTTLSEADIRALYVKMGQDIINKHSGSTDPAEMYNASMSIDNSDSNTYIQDLNQEISALRELISLRQFNSTSIQLSYQSQIDDIIKRNMGLSIEQKTEYLNLSNELSTLQKESDKYTANIRRLEEELRNNEHEIELTQAEIDSLDPNNEEDAAALAVWNQDLNRLTTLNANLSFELLNTKSKQNKCNVKLQNTKTALNKKNDEICANNPELRLRIELFKNMIEQERISCDAEIQTYESQIVVLENARAYAIKELINQPSQAINFEGSHKNDNLMSFDELRAMGLEYSSENGQKLAGTISKHLKGFTGYCSRHVSNALQESGLGNERCGAAADMDTALENNPNFKEIKVSSAEELKRLPAGCILVYERGAAKYSSKYGHIEVTLGDGTAGSDGRTRNLRYSENMSVFVPVKHSA